MTLSVIATIAPKERVDHPLVVERIFAAPRDLVWKAWTESEHLKHWWGPKGYRLTVASLDLRPGGVFHYGLTSPKGDEMWGRFVYREIDAPRRLVYVSSFTDKLGKLTRHPMSATWPLEVMNTLTLAEENGSTKLTISARPFCATETESRIFNNSHDSVHGGLQGTFAQLDDYLAKLMIREYMEAPE